MGPAPPIFGQRPTGYYSALSGGLAEHARASEFIDLVAKRVHQYLHQGKTVPLRHTRDRLLRARKAIDEMMLDPEGVDFLEPWLDVVLAGPTASWTSSSFTNGSPHISTYVASLWATRSRISYLAEAPRSPNRTNRSSSTAWHWPTRPTSMMFPLRTACSAISSHSLATSSMPPWASGSSVLS